MSNYFCFNSFTLFLITIISIETTKITQNTTNIAHTNDTIGITNPLKVINFEILRFQQAIHLAKVHEDIKNGQKIILCEIAKRNYLRGNRKNEEQFMNGILCYHWWKCKMLGWYHFSTKWNFEGASRFCYKQLQDWLSIVNKQLNKQLVTIIYVNMMPPSIIKNN